MFKRADQLRKGDRVRVFDWVGDSYVTDVQGPLNPHVPWRNPDRRVMRVQLDHLSWIVWDADFEVETFND